MWLPGRVADPAAAADCGPMVCGVQGDDALDPRCYATVGIEPRTRALLTPVPYRDALIRTGLSSRRQRPFWAITLRAVAGAAAGVHAELRLWPESNPEWFRSRLAVLCDAEPALIEGLSLEQQHALLARNLAERSYTGFLETAADGLADVGLPGAGAARASRFPPTCRSLRRRAACRRRSTRPSRPCPTRTSSSSRTPRRSRRCASDSHPRPPWRSTSRPTAARSAPPTTGRPPTARCACCRWRPRSAARSCAASSTATRSHRARSLRLLADGREIIAHNARYEQSWLSWHFGLPAWENVFDTSCAFRVFERHWSIQDPAYERRDATLATVTRRLLGAPKGGFGADWWGAEPLPAAQLDYAAYDAVALIDLRERARALADAFGCTDQVLAASRTACREAARRPPASHPHAWTAAVELIGAADDDAGPSRASRR